MNWLTRILTLIGKWTKPKVDPTPSPSGTGDLFAAINAAREQNGRTIFQRSLCLDAGAMTHAKAVALGQQRPHDGFNGRIDACDMNDYNHAGECWASGSDVATFMRLWRGSPGHWAILMSAATYCGAAWVNGSAVAIVGSRESTSRAMGGSQAVHVVQITPTIGASSATLKSRK